MFPRISCILQCLEDLKIDVQGHYTSSDDSKSKRTTVFLEKMSEGVSNIANHHFDITTNVDDGIVMIDQISQRFSVRSQLILNVAKLKTKKKQRMDLVRALMALVNL